jgi:predicted transcriptional regulator
MEAPKDKGKATVERDSGLLSFDEDEETLAAIDRGVAEADANQTVGLDQVRRRVLQWATKSRSRRVQ